MTVTPTQESLLNLVGLDWKIDAYVVGFAFLDGGILAAALGDGRVAFYNAEDINAARVEDVHDGACLSSSIDLGGDRILTGGDDGRLITTSADGEIVIIAELTGSWIEPISINENSKLRAAAFGKTVRIYSGDGSEIRRFEHENTVGGLSFNPKGKQLATAHYGGASLWWTGVENQTPRSLKWAGSHLTLTWSPDGKYIITATQENDLHGWRVADGADMRMAGYLSKVKSMSWLYNGRYLATAGAAPVVCWPFFGKGGPIGKAPIDLQGGTEGIVTVVAAHPKHNVVAAGYQNGAAFLVQMDRPHSALIKHPGEGAVTALNWSADGNELALGTEYGCIGRIGLLDWRAPE